MCIIRKLPSFFIISFWVLMMGLLAKREFLPENISPQKIRFPKEMPYIKGWGIYEKTEKIGYLKTKIFQILGGYLWKNKAEIKLLQDTRFSVSGTAFFGKDTSLANFYIYLKYIDYFLNIKGKFKNKFFNIRMESNTGINRYKIPWSIEKDIMNNGIMPWFYFPGLKAGEKFQWHMINPLTSKEDLVKAVVKRVSFYYNKRSFVPVMVVSVRYRDMNLEFWVDSEGNPLKIITPWGFVLESE